MGLYNHGLKRSSRNDGQLGGCMLIGIWLFIWGISILTAIAVPVAIILACWKYITS